jgi:hypothetical protein
MFLTKVKVAAVTVLALVVLSAGTGKVIWQRQAGAQPPAKEKTAIEKVEADIADRAKQRAVEIDALMNGRRQGQEPPVADMPEQKAKALLAGLKRGKKMNALLKDQYDAAHTEAKARWRGFLFGRETLDILLGASLRLLQAELDLSAQPADQLAAFGAYWQRARDLEMINKDKYDNGRLALQDYAQSRFTRIQAEIWLERAKAGQAVMLTEFSHR